ncbi:MAG: hypothetical protein ACK5LL_17545 [Suipraeoptans sp.]
MVDDVGKEKMLECLQIFAKSEKMKVEIEKCEYIKMLNGTEILMFEEFKVMHTPNSDILSIHTNSQLPIGIQKL